jgi:hypothetical protein
MDIKQPRPISPPRRTPATQRAYEKAWEIEETLSLKDFALDSCVKASPGTGMEVFFSPAFAREWVDAESGIKFFLIFCEHHEPFVIATDDSDAYCRQYSEIQVQTAEG